MPGARGCKLTSEYTFIGFSPVPRSSDQTRPDILQAAYKLFRRRGFFRVGMDEIARTAGVTKRTLYYHFDSKDALLTAVLASQHERAFGAFQTYGIDLSGGPEQLIDKLFGGLARWSAKPRWAGSGFTRLAIELADLSGHPARSMAHQHKALMEQQLATLLAKANVAASRERARELVLLVEGAMVMLLIHGDRDYCTAAVEAAKRLVVDRPAV
ncbi:TetR/AcrR family transcriptional regulator [Mesorhizobium sp. 2RAF45]|uniref:TetR/AcrR family transcriptional regulator n=1 Tax=Mesorhizobium sp. 2RAF45 TaxID=3233001 RepID=UPI003F9EB231